MMVERFAVVAGLWKSGEGRDLHAAVAPEKSDAFIGILYMKYFRNCWIVPHGGSGCCAKI